MKTKTSSKSFDFFPSPKYALMQGADAQAFLEEFNARAEELYGDAGEKVKVLNYNGNTLTGSNPFAVVHVNRVMRPQGILTATPADLEAFRSNLRGTYKDSALVLRSAGDSYEPNDYIARHLSEQLRGSLKRQIGKVPIVIPLVGLNLVRDAKSSYGLSFRLRDGAQPYKAPILAESNSTFRSEDVNAKTGLPTKLGNGDRTLYTRQEGLSRLYLDGSSTCIPTAGTWRFPTRMVG